MLRKFRQLRPDARIALVEAMLLVTGIRILLPAFGLKNVRWILKATGSALHAKPGLHAGEILRLLQAAARRCPVGSTCLTRALAGQLLLRKAGIESRLCIGVMRDQRHAFQAHAWLERDGKVILGGSNEEIRQWSPLSGVDERTA